MSDNYLPLLLADIQNRLVKAEREVQTLKARMDEFDAALVDAEDVDESGTYLDGTPIR